MPLIATVVDPMREPVPAGWDGLVSAERRQPLWSSRLLRAADWCARGGASMVLVAEASSATPVAAFHVRHVGPANPGRFARVGRVSPVNLTVCRTNPLQSAGMMFSADTDRRDRREAVTVFERALARRVGIGGRAIAYSSLTEDHFADLPTDGRLRLPQPPAMVIDNEWSDLSGYLAALPRPWRKRLLQIRRAVEAVDLRIELADSIDPAEACWLSDLVRRRYLRRRFPQPPWPASYFEEFGRLPGAWFLTYRDRQGRLLAYLAGHDNGEELFAGAWGNRSEADGGRRNLYFDNYLRQVELMLSRGRRRLLLGVGMSEIKARYGARAEPRWGLLGLR